MNLISMTDYVLRIEDYKIESHNTERAYSLINNYANFLKQPLKLGMFIPCDENDVPYKCYKSFCHVMDKDNFICEPYEGLFEIQANEKSKGWAYLDTERTRYYDKVSYTRAKTDFEQAKERVLFEGFELLRDVGYAWIFKYNVQNSTLFYKKIEFGVRKSYNIEDLIIDFPEVLKLTDSAIKQPNL